MKTTLKLLLLLAALIGVAVPVGRQRPAAGQQPNTNITSSFAAMC